MILMTEGMGMMMVVVMIKTEMKVVIKKTIER